MKGPGGSRVGRFVGDVESWKQVLALARRRRVDRVSAHTRQGAERTDERPVLMMNWASSSTGEKTRSAVSNAHLPTYRKPPYAPSPLSLPSLQLPAVSRFFPNILVLSMADLSGFVAFERNSLAPPEIIKPHCCTR